MTSTLTKSAVKRLLQGEKLKNPTVQVLQNHVPLYNCDKSKEWAIEISDGKNSHIALINSDLRKRWRNDPSVKSFIIVKLKRYDQLMVEYCRERMLTVLDYEIIDSTLTSKYGNPVGCKLRFVLAVQETKGIDICTRDWFGYACTCNNNNNLLLQIEQKLNIKQTEKKDPSKMSQKSSKCECHHHQATAEKKRAVKKPKSKSASTEAVTAKSVDKKNVKQGLGNPENKLDVKISKNQVGKVVETKHVASTQTSSAFKVKTKSTASWKQTPSGNRPAGGKKEIFTSTTKNGLRKELVADQVEEVTVINSVLAERNQRTPRAGGKNNVDMVTIATQTMTSVSIATQTEFDDDDDDESSSSSEDDSEDAICRNSDCRNPFLVTDEDDIYLFECMKCGSDGYCKMCLDECIVCGFLQCKSCLLLNEPCMNCGYGGFYELNETCDSCQHYKFSVRPCRVCKTRRVCPDCTRHCGNCFLLTFACVRCLIDCGTLCSNRDCESRIADCGCTKNMCTISCDSCQSGYVCFICAADCDICKRHHCEDCVMDFVICEHCGFQMCEACGNEYNYESEESCCYCLNNNFSVAYCDLVNRKCFHGVRGGVEKYNGPYKSRAQFKYELSAATRSSCAKCNKQPGIDQLKLCSRCKSAPYCSRSCQQMDWKKHKQMCGDYIPFDQLPFISACLEEYYERTEKDRKKLCYDAKKNETQIKTNGFESK